MRYFLYASLLHPFFAWGNPSPTPEVWQKITLGMREADVEKLLGTPLSFSLSQNITRKYYGMISEPTEIVPVSLSFFVFFKNGLVIKKQDPWGGGVSVGGVPSIPVPMYPYQNQKFQHYPRWLDIRWHPSAGNAPIDYLVECEMGSTDNPPLWFTKSTRECSHPYLALLHGGSQPGRWRVKARNAAGSSEWSDWQIFSFADK
jgi:hypothetical protein